MEILFEKQMVRKNRMEFLKPNPVRWTVARLLTYMCFLKRCNLRAPRYTLALHFTVLFSHVFWFLQRSHSCGDFEAWTGYSGGHITSLQLVGSTGSGMMGFS